MARKKSQKTLQRELITDQINSYRDQMQKQAEAEMAQNYAPAITNSGMSKEDISGIINSYRSQQQEIPKLEQNTTPTTPSISDELKRMEKAKADTTTPRTPGEQQAIDTYYNSLLEASGKQPSTSAPTSTPTTPSSVDYRAELDRVRAMKSDTSTTRTEGENQAIDTYLASLEEAQRYLDSQKPITTKSVKKSGSNNKVTNKSVKNIGTIEVKADGTKNYTKTMSPNEQRDYERALLAQSKARGRALSPNEQRDLERAQNAIAQAKEREKVTTETKNVALPTTAKENSNTTLERKTLTKATATPVVTPTPDAFHEATQEMLDTQEIIPNIDETRGKNYALAQPGIKPVFDKNNSFQATKDLALAGVKTYENTPQKVLYSYGIPSNKWEEIAEDIDHYNIWRGEQNGINGANPIATWRSSNISKELQEKYGLDKETLNNLANDYKYAKSTFEGERKERAAQKFGADHNVKGSIMSLGASALGGILSPVQIADDLTNYVYNGQKVSPYEGAHLLSKEKNAYREGVKENINSDLGKGIYDVAMGVGDMGIATIPALTGAPISPALGLALETANDASTSALERGNNPIQASAYAVASGSLDYLLNRIGLDKAKDLALDSIKSAGIKKFLTQNLVAGGIEAGENVLQDIGQTAFDELINNKNSEMRVSYAQKIANGESEEQALKEVIADKVKQMAISAGTGFAMGSTMQGASSLINDAYARVILNDIENNSQKVQNMVNDYKSGKLNAARLSEENADINNAVEAQRQAINNIEKLGNQIPGDPTNLEESNVDNRFLKDSDLNDYLRSGKGFHKNRADAVSRGENVIIRSFNELKNKINNIIFSDDADVTKMQTVGFMRVGQNITDQIRNLDNSIDTTNYFFQIEPNDLKHSYLEHSEPKIEGDLPMSDNDIAYALSNINDGTVESIEKIKGGGKRAKIRIQAPDGNYVTIQVVSKNDGALSLKSIWKTEKDALDATEDLTNPTTVRSQNVFSNGENPTTDSLSNSKVNQIDKSVNPSIITNQNVIEGETPEGITSGRKKQSRVVTNSAINGDIITPEEYANNPELQKIAEYEEHSNIRTYKQAQRDVADNGAQLAQEYINGSRAINTDLDVDRSMILMQQLAREIDNSENPTSLIAQRDAILRNAVENGTEKGQFIQAFAKYANTPEDALLKATKLDMESTSKWKSRHKKAQESNSRIAKALEQMGHKPENVERTPLTHEQLKERVKAEIEKEMGSIADQFTDNDLEYLTILAENKDIPVWQITSEIEHKLQTGEWYTLDESIEPPKPGSRKLQNALNRLVAEESPAPERKSFEQVREEVKNTLDKEYGSVNDFTDSDIDYLSNLIEQGATAKEITDSINTRLATGRWGISTETQNAVNDIFDTIRHYDENSREFVEGQAEAFRLLAEEVAPEATAFEKFDAWRYIAMLGNPKTMLRNYLGNKIFGAVVGTSNSLSAMLEAGVDRTVKAKGAREAKKAEKINNRIAKLEESNSTRAQKEIPRLSEKAQMYEERSREHSQGIERTKSVLNPLGSDRDLIDASYLDGFGKRYRQFEGSKYEKATKDAIRQERSVFDSKAMQLVEKAVDRGISDTKAVAKKYSTSLAGYLKANGYDASVFDLQNEYDSLKQASRNRDLTPDEVARMKELKPTIDFLEKARDYAVEQAEYATFHEDNRMAEWLSEMSRKAPGIGKYVIEGTVPFKKTPANILRSGFEYSPFGAIKSIMKTGKLIYENTGSRKGNLEDTYTTKRGKEVSRTLANDVIDSWSKTLTGSALAGLGYYLFNKGILTSSTKDEKYQDQLEGIGNYAININGHTYTLDWLAPGVMPLLVGAEVNKVLKDNAISDKEWYANPDKWLNTINAILDPMFETSMLSGIKDTLQTAANEVRYNEENAIGGIMGSLIGNAATNYASQAIPTLFGQVARTIDPVRRTTDTYNEGILGVLEKQGRKAANKIPFLTQINTPYVDAKGQRQYNSPFRGEGVLPTLGNLTYQMLSPGYYSQATTNDADVMARNVYNETKEPKVFADWKSTKKINGEKLNPAQMLTYREQMGKANDEVRNLLAHNEDFLNMSYDAQKDVLKSVNTFADKYGESVVNPNFKTTDKLYNAYYKTGSFKGVVDEIVTSHYMDEAGVKANSNVGKEINEAVKSGDTQKAVEIAETTKTLTDYGLTKDNPIKAYEKAQSVIPSLTVDDFANQYKAIDSDGNQGIKQDEIIDYLNRGSYTQKEGDQIWSIYSGSEKTIPVLEDKKWSKKRVKK